MTADTMDARVEALARHLAIEHALARGDAPTVKKSVADAEWPSWVKHAREYLAASDAVAQPPHPQFFAVDYTGVICSFGKREDAIKAAQQFAETANGGTPTLTRSALLAAQAPQQAAWIAHCCECGRIVDTREQKDGGDPFGCELSDGRWTCSFDCWDLAVGEAPQQPVAFQQRVAPWMQACFGAEISADKVERGDRLVEEVFETLQSGGYDPARIAPLRDYVWSRPTGEPDQEVGGVMVTLAAYCLAHGLDMHAAGETELARIWTKVEKIRAKQATKPTGSALPVPASPPREEDAPRPMTGFWNSLSPEQQAAALAYQGDDTCGVWPREEDVQRLVAAARREALEEAAALARGNVVFERYREWPFYGSGNRANDSYHTKFADSVADAIRALIQSQPLQEGE